MTRHCARPGCNQGAVATLSYDYANSTAWLDGLATEPHPMTHDLCPMHAENLSVPRGWGLVDRRAPAPVADWPHLAAS
jgi:hypothetical protein